MNYELVYYKLNIVRVPKS